MRFALHRPMNLHNTVAPALTLEERFEQRQRLNAIITETTKQLDAENAAIKKDMILRGLDEYVVGDQKLVLSARDGRRTLDRGRLIELGVSTETIDAAIVEGKGYVQLDVRKVKD